jgi:hypothetical protein
LFIFCSFIPPDTEKSWDAGGLKLELITPMKRWSISYEGTMIHQTTGKAHQVNLKVRNYIRGHSNNT